MKRKAKLVCSKCMEVFDDFQHGQCPKCKAGLPHVYEYNASDEYLSREVPRVREERKRAGLEGLVDGLECVIINTEPDNQQAAINELLRRTGLEFAGAYRDNHYRTCILKRANSADFLIRSRIGNKNPFKHLNLYPKSKNLPDTRLETLVFRTKNLDKYVSIQKYRRIAFLTEEVIDTGNYSFIQTAPSPFTGNSLGFIQWHRHRHRGDYATTESEMLDWNPIKPDYDYLNNIKHLDHAATRLQAEYRDAAIIDFMNLTNYNFDFSIYVKVFNSITTVARLSKSDFAMVFTTGIAPYVSEHESGPTEKFVHHYGPRVHHIAFHTEHIEDTYAALVEDGVRFLIELVGSPEEGLKQTFSEPSEPTLLVNEYIHRYGDFDGFFTKSNVTLLTGATARQ